MQGRRLLFQTLFTVLGSAHLAAAEPVGQAVLIKTEVTGQAGPIEVNTSVHRDERIKTSQSGLGQFLFRDGTKLAVGWGSSVVIDKYVFDDSQSVKKLTIKAAKGTFRWVSGNSKSSAYQILTPAGTIGVRGTAFDFYVGPDGTTAVVLLNGAASFCGPGGCRQLQQRCDCVVAKPNGDMSPARRVDPSVLDKLGTSRALPFLSGNQRLVGGIGMLGGCNMASVAPERKDRTRPPPAIAPTPQRQDPPQRQAEPQKERPAKPDKPDHEKPHHDKPHHHKPDRHDKHDGHGRHDDDGKPGNHGEDHRGHDRDRHGYRDHNRDHDRDSDLSHDRSRSFNRGR
ncbi:FecR domain-containing protein [Rhizobium bangladeshense]|uniref:FecR family protein n=1 Tax=Rhizobium bangladeshense TaxID=1138189 RepID=UPI001A98C89C|nr:FecR domain-containing protein [Rhizobium bangladeshense]QSY96452.1 FecR domain-containing protein [Rhizobium bangladeshense]